MTSRSGLFETAAFATSLALAGTAAAAAPAGGAAAEVAAIVAFGASLTDTGGRFSVFQATADPALSPFPVPTSPPYFEGRFSNGPVYIEHLAVQLGLDPADGENFAFGGATARPFDPAEPLQTDANFSGQIDLFEEAVGGFGPGDLVVVSFGGNDVPQIEAGTDGRAVDAGIRRSIAAIRVGLNRLRHLGAEQILVLNLPRFSLTPVIAGEPRAEALDRIGATFNRELRTVVAHLDGRPGVEADLVDLRLLFELLVALPDRFGLENLEQPCLVGSPFARVPTPNPALDCDDPAVLEATLFWDERFHPTTRIHALIGRFVALHLG